MSVETATGTAAGPKFRPLPPLPAHWRSLSRAFVHQARALRGKPALCDSTKVHLTFGETFLRAAALGRVLERLVGPGRYVGLLIPPMVPAAVANLALALFGKIPVNLNYTASQELVDSSIDQCGITHVITSRKVLDKFKITPKGTLIFLEDLPAQVTKLDKLWAFTVARLVPIAALGAFLPGLKGDRPEETATIIFTSGSTGDPKGVVLSHRNILSNIFQFENHLHILPDEVVLGILPFFHSFGFTVALWTPLCLGKRVVYHFSPLDAKVIGRLCEEHGVTLLAATPTYMRIYLKSCPAKQFAALKHLLLGAEKLKPELARDIREALGIDPIEGYGCTELSPVVAFNVPHDQTLADGRTIHGNRIGTVGLPLPGTAIKTTDAETGADLPPGAEGVVCVQGPQVMVGYLNRPEATAAVLKDGWYSTGDLGYLDPDGFLKITDRLSRFSKIGGEMVPHLSVEAAILQVTGVDEAAVAVTSLPDVKRGERLCVVYTDLGATPQEVYKRLSAGTLPKLWLPAAEDFVAVDALPILGSGKVDLRGLRKAAAARLGGGEAPH